MRLNRPAVDNIDDQFQVGILDRFTAECHWLFHVRLLPFVVTQANGSLLRPPSEIQNAISDAACRQKWEVRVGA